MSQIVSQSGPNAHQSADYPEGEKSSTILIVDDNPDNLRLLFSTFKASPYRVLAARDARSAMARVAHITPDLILLDVMMPDMNGFELCQQLRQRPQLQDTPIIFLSALDDSDTVVQGLKMNAVDYIAKPFRPEEVLARVERHLELARLRLRLEAQNRQLTMEMQRRQRSEEAYRLLVEHSPQGLAIVQQQRFVFINPTLGNISGYAPETLLNLSVAEVEQQLFPATPQLLSDWIEQIPQGIRGDAEIVHAQHSNGTARWWEITIARLLYQEHESVQIAVVDATERMEFEHIAQAAQERVEKQAIRLSILNEIALSFSDITDLDSAVASASTALSHLFRGSDIAIMIRDEAGESIQVASHLNPTGDGLMQGRRFAIHGDGLLEPMQQNFSARWMDVQAVAHSPLAASFGLLGIPPLAIAAPLVTHGHFIGTLLLIPGHHEKGYQEEDIWLAETTAAQMAGAIESAQLFHEIQARHQDLIRQQRFTQSLLEASPGPVFVKDREECLIMVNRAFADIYGVSPEDMIGQREELFNEDAQQINRFRRNNHETLASGRTIQTQEELIPAPDGTPRWYKTAVSPFFDELGNAQGIIGTLTDITAQKQAEIKLAKTLTETEQLANQDGLTGLANRRQLDQSLHREWRRARREQKPLALLMLDVDYFKQYNDRYGHLAGDDCLRAIARQLEQSIQRPGDLAARYGGEEFVVLMPGTNLAGAQQMAQMLRQRMADLAIEHADSPSGRLTISIGVVASMPDDNAPEHLLKQADSNLYQAKLQGRDRIVG